MLLHSPATPKNQMFGKAMIDRPRGVGWFADPRGKPRLFRYGKDLVDFAMGLIFLKSQPATELAYAAAQSVATPTSGDGITVSGTPGSMNTHWGGVGRTRAKSFHVPIPDHLSGSCSSYNTPQSWRGLSSCLGCSTSTAAGSEPLCFVVHLLCAPGENDGRLLGVPAEGGGGRRGSRGKPPRYDLHYACREPTPPIFGRCSSRWVLCGLCIPHCMSSTNPSKLPRCQALEEKTAVTEGKPGGPSIFM